MASLTHFSSLAACQGFKNNNTDSLALLQSGNGNHIAMNHQKPNSTIFAPLSSLSLNEKKKSQFIAYNNQADNVAFLEKVPDLFEGAEDFVKSFYDDINTQNFKHLNGSLAPDCAFQGLLGLFTGNKRENIITYLQNMRQKMGPLIYFEIKDMVFSCKLEKEITTEEVQKPGQATPANQNEKTITVMKEIHVITEWRLVYGPTTVDGKRTELPYFHGRNEFIIVKEKENFKIKEINGIDEFPIKPRDLLLEDLPFFFVKRTLMT